MQKPRMRRVLLVISGAPANAMALEADLLRLAPEAKNLDIVLVKNFAQFLQAFIGDRGEELGVFNFLTYGTPSPAEAIRLLDDYQLSTVERWKSSYECVVISPELTREEWNPGRLPEYYGLEVAHICQMTRTPCAFVVNPEEGWIYDHCQTLGPLVVEWDADNGTNEWEVAIDNLLPQSAGIISEAAPYVMVAQPPF